MAKRVRLRYIVMTALNCLETPWLVPSMVTNFGTKVAITRLTKRWCRDSCT